MLSNVSWGEFIEVVVILLVLYYLFIGVKYYREEIKSLLSGKLRKKDKAAVQQPGQANGKSSTNDPAFDELEAVVNDLRYGVFERAGKSVSKKELLEQLQERLSKYSNLRIPGYKVAINNYIIIHAEEICGIVFSEHELNSAWNKQTR
jgi:hypothetical protein